MSATSIDLSQIKTDALSAASTFRTLIGLGTSDTPTFKSATLSAGTLNGTVLDISQTWGGTGTYTGIKYNVTDSGPANAASLLMDLQVGGTYKFKVERSGYIYTSNGAAFGAVLSLSYFGVWDVRLNNASPLIWSAGDAVTGGIATQLLTEASGVLAQRNSTNAQTFRIYNTTDAGLLNYERAKIAWSSNVLQIGTEKLGTGSARALELQTDGTTRLTIGTDGVSTFNNVVNSSSYRINGSDIAAEATILTRLGLRLGGGGYSVVRLGGVYQSNNTIILIGGEGSSFPAIKRNSAALNFRLADDSADCDITAAKATLSATLDLTIRTVTYGATMAIDAALGNKIAITLAGNGTISNPTNAVDGRVLVFRLRQDATGSRIPVWDTKYSFVGDLATVTLSTAANKIDRVAFEYDSTDDKWYCISFIKGS